MIPAAAQDPVTLSQKSSIPPRALVVCEGIDAVIRVSAWLSELPDGTQRFDLTLNEALEQLRSSATQPYDVIAFAPDAATLGKRMAAQDFIRLAEKSALRTVMLLAPDSKVGFDVPASVEVYSGPPFVRKHSAKKPAGADAPGPKSRLSDTLQGIVGRFKTPFKKPSAPEFVLREETDQPPYRVIGVQGLSGGTGASTAAIILAQEIARQRKDLQVLLVDLNLQFASLASYLDRAEDPRVTDLYTRLESVDSESVSACLQQVSDNLQLFAAPSEILPVDTIMPRHVSRLLKQLHANADVIIIDMPSAFAEWVDSLWQELDLVIAVSLVDVRCQTNFRRLRSLSGEKLFHPEKTRIWLNRRPAQMNGDQSAAAQAFMAAFAGMEVTQLPDVGMALCEVQALGQSPRMDRRTTPLADAISAEATKLSTQLKAHHKLAGRHV